MSKGKDKVKASWNTETTKIFIDMCLEALKKGHRRGGSFKKEGWTEISQGFTEKTGRSYERMQLKNKYDSLRKEWQVWDRMCRETGVGWDKEKNTIEADDDWWEKKMPVGYERFRNKGIQFEDEMKQLFSTVAASGPQQWAPSSMEMPLEAPPVHVNEIEEGSGESDEYPNSSTGLSGGINSVTFSPVNLGSEGNEDVSEPGCAARTASGCNTSSSTGKRKRNRTIKKKGSSASLITEALTKIIDMDETMEERLERMAAEAARLAAEERAERRAAEERAEKRAAEEHAARMAAEARAYERSIAGVIEHLNQIPEVINDIDFHARCTMFLMNDPNAREAFVALKHMREHLLQFLRRSAY